MFGDQRKSLGLASLDGAIIATDVKVPWYAMTAQKRGNALWTGAGERVVDGVHCSPIPFADPRRGPHGIFAFDDAVLCLEALPGEAERSVLRRFVRAT